MTQPQRSAAMLAPVMLIIAVLFCGGLLLAVWQSLGLMDPGGAPRFTLAHYAALFQDGEFRASLLYTLTVATAATALSAAAGLLLALGLREAAARVPLVHTLLQVPVATPHLAMAVVLINLISPSGLIARVGYHAGLISSPQDFPSLIADRFGAGIVLGYALKETPFIALMCAAVLARTGPEYEMAARTLGASAWQRFRHVTLPLVAPALVSASLVVMAFVFGAFEVPYILGRPYPAMLGVLAQQRFSGIDLADRAAAMAVATVVSVLTAAVVWVYLRLSRIVIGTEEPTIF